jgi:dTMP kinase
MSGIFITFEGIEGSGKSTLIDNVAVALRQAGRDPLMTREPGGTTLGVALRKVLLNPEMEKLGSMAELMLFAADRAQHVFQVILPALEAGQIVLCDRYSDATIAYQGHGRGIPLDVITVVDDHARSKAIPHMTVLLDLPAETGLTRARTRNKESMDSSESRIDEEEMAFHQRVREGYLMLADQEPERFLVLDAREKSDRMAEHVMNGIRSRFPDAV